jgi:hypothetical protein
MHFRMEGRDLARSWTIGEYARTVREETGKKAESELVSLIPAQPFKAH